MYRAIKAIYDHSRSGTNPVGSVNSSTIIKEKEVTARWKEHFNKLLHQPFTVDQEALQQKTSEVYIGRP